MTYTWSQLLDHLLAGEALSAAEHEWAREQIAGGSGTPGQRNAYLVAQQPGWNLIDGLAAAPGQFEALLRPAAAEALLLAPAPGQWSAQQIINHMADNELVNGVRVRLVLTEERPALMGYDSDVWAPRFFNLEDTWTAFQRWTLVRENLVRLCRTLSGEDWHRVGFLSYRGDEPLRVLLGVLAGHDHAHLRQLERTLKAVSPSRLDD
jgi:hypothetical protein